MNLSKKKMSIVLLAVIALLAVSAGIGWNVTSDGEAVDMVLCLDDSGSMNSKQAERNQAAMDLINQLNHNVNMGGLYFQYNVTMNAPIRNLGSYGARRDLKEMFSDQHSDERGNTNFGEALREALSMIKRYKEYGEEQNPSVILLFTDGENDFLDENGKRIYEYIEEADWKAEEATGNAVRDNVVVHTICLNENDIESLKKVSARTGGTYTRIDSIEELSDALLLAAAPYTKRKPGGITGMGILILLVVAGVGGVAFYYFQNFKKQEYLMDYQVDMMKDEIDQRNKREELDAQIREEQKNKKFYQDIVVTHGNAIGGKSCFDNEGRRRSGILSVGDIVMVGRNARGEDYTYRIDEAGLELWATFDENELILRSKKTPFEIRKEGIARDQGDRTQKAVIKSGQQYYIILGTKHEIGLLATRGR